MTYHSFEVVIEREDDPLAGFSAYSPSLPGCTSNGSTIEEAKANIREAVALHLEMLRAKGEPVPPNDRIVHVEELTFALPA